MTDQKSNERDGQPEAVQSPEITTDFSSLELETLDTARLDFFCACVARCGNVDSVNHTAF